MVSEDSIEVSGEQSGYFRFANDAKDYAKKIGFGSKNNPVIEFYWLCAQLGLVAYDDDKTIPNAPGAGNELVQDFAGKTRHYQILIRSFLLYRYLSSNSFDIDDLDEEEAEEIENLMDTFLQSTGSHLKNNGMKQLDAFAQKGWNIILAKNLNMITELDLFLEQYVNVIQSYDK